MIGQWLPFISQVHDSMHPVPSAIQIQPIPLMLFVSCQAMFADYLPLHLQNHSSHDVQTADQTGIVQNILLCQQLFLKVSVIE